MKFRKKPVEIEAFLFTGHPLSAASIVRWARECVGVEAENPISHDKESYEGTGDEHVLRIRTLEGVVTARTGDYVIRGVKGEFYPCKPDIFERTYEPV